MNNTTAAASSSSSAIIATSSLLAAFANAIVALSLAWLVDTILFLGGCHFMMMLMMLMIMSRPHCIVINTIISCCVR